MTTLHCSNLPISKSVLFPQWYENKTRHQTTTVLKMTIWSKWKVGNRLLLSVSSSQIWDTCQHWRNSVSTEDNNLQKENGLWDGNWDMGLRTGLSGSGRFRFKYLPKIIFKNNTKSETIDVVQSPAEESEFLFFSHDSCSVKTSAYISECSIQHFIIYHL